MLCNPQGEGQHTLCPPGIVPDSQGGGGIRQSLPAIQAPPFHCGQMKTEQMNPQNLQLSALDLNRKNSYGKE